MKTIIERKRDEPSTLWFDLKGSHQGNEEVKSTKFQVLVQVYKLLIFLDWDVEETMRDSMLWAQGFHSQSTNRTIISLDSTLNIRLLHIIISTSHNLSKD